MCVCVSPSAQGYMLKVQCSSGLEDIFLRFSGDVLGSKIARKVCCCCPYAWGCMFKFQVGFGLEFVFYYYISETYSKVSMFYVIWS